MKEYHPGNWIKFKGLPWRKIHQHCGDQFILINGRRVYIWDLIHGDPSTDVEMNAPSVSALSDKELMEDTQ